jgi:S-formylglutathione hydrolase FrmB
MKIHDSKHLFARRSRWRVATVTLAIAGVVLGGGAMGAVPAVAASSFVDVPGAHIVSETVIDSRTVSLSISTPSFTTPTTVEVMLPVGYETDASRSWPVTYFLGGTADAVTAFRTRFDGEASTASYPSIIVEPDGASGSWSDWYNSGAGGPPLYETFVTAQLIPLIDANFRTLATRSERAVMGESMGGAGAMMFAARHPDLFVAASSLSGAVDSITLLDSALVTVAPVVAGSLPTSIWGPYPTEEVRWRGHNPTDLASNLRNVDLQVFEGNGVLGLAQGESVTDAKFCAVEAAGIVPMTTHFDNALTSLGIPYAFKQYSFGCHSDTLFAQEIRDTLPGFERAFGTPGPTTFDYRSVESSFSVYGWSVGADPARAMEFLALTGVNNQGFTIAGSGLTTVTTPAQFDPAQSVTVTVDGFTTNYIADASGRLTFTVDLGSPDTGQQYRLGTTTVVRTAHVVLGGS